MKAGLKACATNVADEMSCARSLAEAYLRFKRAGAPAELHIYGSGGHGFGLRPTTPVPRARGSILDPSQSRIPDL